MAGTFKVGSLQLESIDGLQTATVTHGNDDTVTFDKVVKVPTAAAGTNTTQVATTAYVDGKMVLGTAVASTSGTSIDFTGIPSWAKKITVMFSGVSTNGASRIILRIGAGSIDTSGYQATATLNGLDLTETSGYFACYRSDAANIVNGAITLTFLGSNIYVQDGSTSAGEGAASCAVFAGTKTLLATLDRVRITTVNGTDAFDAGSINIMYEG